MPRAAAIRCRSSLQPDRAWRRRQRSGLRLIGMHDRKTVGQVSLRFPIQEGAIVIARTSKRERLEKHDDFYFNGDKRPLDR